jgi:hypothetical protein
MRKTQANHVDGDDTDDRTGNCIKSAKERM